MKRVRPSAPHLAAITPYDPKSLPADVFISANESPYNLPGEVRAAVRERLSGLAFNRYPDPLANKLRDLIAERQGLARGNVLCGNGGDELLFDLMLAWGGPGRTLLNFPPTFSIYEGYAELTHTAVENMPRQGDDFHIDIDAAVERVSRGDIDIVIITSPNNPTGCTVPEADIRCILDASDALVLVDEAYIEFAPEASVTKLLAEYENLLILRTFSKAYSCAGVRMGYYLANESVITEFLKVRQAYTVDALSQVVCEEAYKRQDLIAANTERIVSERERLVRELAAIEGVHVHPTEANFILVDIPGAVEVWERLHEEYSVLVRNVGGDPLLKGCLRITIGTPEENDRLLQGLRDLLS